MLAPMRHDNFGDNLVHAQTITPTITPLDIMDRSKMASLQILTLVLGFLILTADGFDVASVGYVAPLLRKEWALTGPQLGPIFGAGLLGLCLGSFLFGPMADRIGRKRVILISMIVFGISSLACAKAPSVGWLIALRFATGMGLGGALPTMITLASEFSPARTRSLMVTLMLAGFPLGLAFGGLVAAQLIPSFGWKGVFVFGGLLPLALLPVIWVWLPESLKFMAGKPRHVKEFRSVLKRLTGDADFSYDDVIAPNPAIAKGTPAAPQQTPAAILFSAHYRVGTLLLWLCFFCTLWVYYELSSWLPTVITDAGIDVSRAALVSMMIPLGGILGGMGNAYLMDRMNPFLVLTGSYVVAAIAIVLIGMSIHKPQWIYVIAFMAGAGLSGAQTGINVLSAGFYTTAARATGVSWALAVGRVGSIIGAMTGGLMLAAVPSIEIAFVIFAVPAVLAAGAMFVLGRLYHGKKALA